MIELIPIVGPAAVLLFTAMLFAVPAARDLGALALVPVEDAAVPVENN